MRIGSLRFPYLYSISAADAKVMLLHAITCLLTLAVPNLSMNERYSYIDVHGRKHKLNARGEGWHVRPAEELAFCVAI